jgi:uncharacterized cupin superfamily protein
VKVDGRARLAADSRRHGQPGGGEPADTIGREEAAVEVYPGVYVSSLTTDEWRPDAEVGGEMHVLVEDADTYAGLSRFVDIADPEPWTLPERETILILQGAARIEIAGGPTLDLRAGDLASLPKGAVTTWHLELPFKELWFFGRPYEMDKRRNNENAP